MLLYTLAQNELTIKVEHEKQQGGIHYPLYYTIHITWLRNLEEALLILSKVRQLESTTERREGWSEEADIVHMHWRETINKIYSSTKKKH